MKYSGSISDRIKALRAEMRREKIDLYIIPSTDYPVSYTHLTLPTN